MSDFLQESVTFERISVIAKLGCLDACNSYERQIVLTLICELADDAREEIIQKSNKQVRPLESSQLEEDITQSDCSRF